MVDRDRWCDDFVDELIKLRPHVSHKLARTLALHQYDAKEDPRDKARQYDKAQRGGDQKSTEPAKPRRK